MVCLVGCARACQHLSQLLLLPCAGFVTEEELAGSGGMAAAAQQQQEVAAPLGLGASVPRWLRWQQPVPLHPLQHEELHAAVLQAVLAWQAFDASHAPLPLHSFMYHHMALEHGSAEAAATAAYSLYYACSVEAGRGGRRSSAGGHGELVGVFWAVLTGQGAAEQLHAAVQQARSAMQQAQEQQECVQEQVQQQEQQEQQAEAPVVLPSVEWPELQPAVQDAGAGLGP